MRAVPVWMLLIVLTGLSAPAAAADTGPPSAELVTITERGFAATWTTDEPSDTTVCVGRKSGRQRCTLQQRRTRFHHAEVDGLRPGTRYAYTLRSRGAIQPLSAFNPGSFTTLTRPPGPHLLDVAVLSDIHLGEECSGTAQTIGGQSVPPCFKAPHYSRRMARAAVAEINARRIRLTVVNADNTSHGEHAQAVAARRVLARLRGRYMIARGSHDRPGQNPPDPRCGADNDCFRAVFFRRRAPGRIFASVERRGVRVVVLDSVDPGSGQGDLTAADQSAFLRRELARGDRRGHRTFVAFHHPVAEHSTTYAVPPVVFGVRPERGGQAFLQTMAQFPGVAGVITSHTHRNFVTYSPHTGARLPYIETGPTKEYPGGYSVLSIHKGGYMRTFHRLRCRFCREWIATTRGEYHGLYPLYTLGTPAARGFTHVYGCDAPAAPPPVLGFEPVESPAAGAACG